MKFAVIGTGSMGRRRIGHVLWANAGEVVAYDTREDRRRETEERFGIKTLASVQELLEERPEAIFICVPPADHMFYLKMSLAQKWHFMCENPVWHRTDGLEKIGARARENGTVANVSCNMRFQRSVKKMKELVREGRVGRVLTGWVEVGEWLPDWHPWEHYADYYPSKRDMGGGLDSICDLDWIMDLFGKVEKVVCMADKKSSLEIDTDDVVCMILGFSGGPILHLHSDMIQRTYTHDAKFVGERGTVIWRCAERKVYLYTDESRQWMEFSEGSFEGKAWAEEMYEKDTEHFLKCLRGEAEPLNTVESNAETLKVVLDALRSSREMSFVSY